MSAAPTMRERRPAREKILPVACLLLVAGRLVACSSSPPTLGPCLGDVVETARGMFCPVDTPVCDGDTVVGNFVHCDALGAYACSGPPQVQRTPCVAGAVCAVPAPGAAALCLTRVSPPTLDCTTASDCEVPPPACLERASRVVYGEPSCQEGQCRWKESIHSCAPARPSYAPDPSLYSCDLPSGMCVVQPDWENAPTPVPTPVPLVAPPSQACAKAADCTPPAPTCFSASVLSYVDPACEAGSCVWEMALSECPIACMDGACATVQCRHDADCAAWAPACEAEGCHAPRCQAGNCVCRSSEEGPCP